MQGFVDSPLLASERNSCHSHPLVSLSWIGTHRNVRPLPLLVELGALLAAVLPLEGLGALPFAVPPLEDLWAHMLGVPPLDFHWGRLCLEHLHLIRDRNTGLGIEVPLKTQNSTPPTRPTMGNSIRERA